MTATPIVTHHSQPPRTKAPPHTKEAPKKTVHTKKPHHSSQALPTTHFISTHVPIPRSKGPKSTTKGKRAADEALDNDDDEEEGEEEENEDEGMDELMQSEENNDNASEFGQTDLNLVSTVRTLPPWEDMRQHDRSKALIPGADSRLPGDYQVDPSNHDYGEPSSDMRNPYDYGSSNGDFDDSSFNLDELDRYPSR